MVDRTLKSSYPQTKLYLAGHSVGFSDLVSPVTPAHRDDRQLGQDDGTTDGSGHFLGTLHTQTNMPVVVPHCNKGLQRQADKSDTQSISSLFDNFELELSAVPVFFVFFYQ